MKINAIVPVLVLCVSFLSGCATIVRDGSQPVAFSSEPQGALVSINGVKSGTTPTTIMVKRSAKKQIVQYELEGYKTETFKLDKSVAPMTFGNIIFGGIIGFGVDMASGAATSYEDSVHVILTPGDQQIQTKVTIKEEEIQAEVQTEHIPNI